MKDSHKDRLLDELRRRLGGYEEAPDADVWDKIQAGVHPSSEGSWVPWAMRAGTVAALLFFSLSLLPRFDNALKGVMELRPETDGSPSPDPIGTIQSPPVSTGSSGVTPSAGTRHVTSGQTSRASAGELYSGDTVRLSSRGPQVYESQQAGNAISSDSLQQDLMTDEMRTDSADMADSRAVRARSRLKKPIVFYGGFSGSLAFQKVMPLVNDGIAIHSVHTRHVFSQERFGVSLHAGIQARVAPRLELYSGVTLYTQSLRLVYEYASEDMVVDQDNTFEYSISPEAKRSAIEYNMLNAGVETGFLYYLTGDRLMHKLGAGLLWQHGFRSSSADNSYDNARSHYLLYQLLYRNELIVNNKTNFFVQPFYRHALASRERLSGPFEVRSYYAGITLGIVYRP